MDLFRKNQKYVFWVVAAIIIPSFVLVWGVDRGGSGGRQPEFTVGAVNGKELKSSELEHFQRRLRGALGGLPLQFSRLPEAGTRAEDLSSYVYAYAMLQDAQKAGVTASDLQVGTYLDNSHPVISPGIDKKDPASRDRVVNEFCRQMQISRAELLQGIREWQTIGNYIDTDNRLMTVSDESVYAFYSLNKSEIVVKRMRFMENDDLRERAKAEIMAKPAEELEREARNYAAGKSSEQRYREPSKWRFSWIMVPFVPSSSVTVSDAEIERNYEEGRISRYENKPLAEVRDRIHADLIKQEIERQTRRNFTVDVDPQLREQSDMAPGDLIKLAQLAKHGVAIGDTGPEGVAPADILKALPEGAGMEFGSALEAIDGFAPAVRDAIIADLKNGYNLSGPAYRAERGLYRLHLVNYQPSTPALLDGPDGKMVPALYETALSDMVGDRAAEMAHQEAADVEAKILAYTTAKQKGEAFPDPEFAEQFEGLPTSVIPYLQIADSSYGIGTLPIGDVMAPRPFVDPETGTRGQELIAVVDRRVPARSTFDSEPEDVKLRYRQIALANYRGNYGVAESQNGGLAVHINPSASLMGGLLDRYFKGQIRVNMDLFSGNGEG